MSLLPSRTETEQTDVLAQYLRNDRLHQSKNIEGSNFRKVLIGLAQEWLRFRDKADEVYDEYDPNNTTALITEWETMVGIPDECIGNTGTIEERRTNVLLKLAGINATTAEQFEVIAATLGIPVVVEPGYESSTFPLTLPFTLFGEDEVPFLIVVTLDAALQPSGLPETLPFTLTNDVPDVLECLFNKLKPANTTIIFRYS
jgi:uncharacterized protein YmfQ (DUF2313 family)